MDVEQPPPPPPPLPPKQEPRASSFRLKTRETPPGWAFEGKVVNPIRDSFLPPAGVYFLYGTLRSPKMLADILGLPSPPVLRPAHVVGYHVKLWGQYPALVDGDAGEIVHGSAFEVADLAAAQKLAYYETSNYELEPCTVRISEDNEPKSLDGFTFMYCGDPDDLSDGHFDLNAWLKHMRLDPVDKM